MVDSAPYSAFTSASRLVGSVWVRLRVPTLRGTTCSIPLTKSEPTRPQRKAPHADNNSKAEGMSRIISRQFDSGLFHVDTAILSSKRGSAAKRKARVHRHLLGETTIALFLQRYMKVACRVWGVSTLKCGKLYHSRRRGSRIDYQDTPLPDMQGI